MSAPSQPPDEADDPSVCQNPGHRGVTDYPWADLFDDPRRETRVAALREITEADGYGVHFAALVKHLYDYEAVRNATYDYKRLKDFTDALERHDLVRIKRVGPQERPRDRPRLVTPTAEAFQAVRLLAAEPVLDRTASGSTERSPESRTGSTETTPVSEDAAPGTAGAESGSVAQRNAAVMLRRRRTMDTAVVHGGLVGSLAGKLMGEERGVGHRTRFNNGARAAQMAQRVRTAFRGAREGGFDRGVVVTATTDPARYESIAAAADGLVDDVELLRRWVARRIGGRPPGVVVLEPTKRGVPHAHVVLFTDPAAFPTDHDLHDYWLEQRGRGFEIESHPIRLHGTTFGWAESGPVGGCPLEAYVGKGPSSLEVVAGLDAELVLEVAAAYRARGDEPVTADLDAGVRAETGVDAEAVRWGAWYFGTELRPVTTPSRMLREAVPSQREV